MPSQQGIFPKRSYGWKSKIDFFPLIPDHTLWISWPRAHLSYIGWVQVGGALALVCSFHYPLRLFSFMPMSFLPCLVLLCVSSTHAYLPRKGVSASGFSLFLLIPSWACLLVWHKFLPNQFVGLLFFFLINSVPLVSFSFIAVVMGLSAHWFFTSSFGSSWPIYFTFTSFLPISLLAVISYHVGPLGIYLFYWTFIARLLNFYLSLCPWAC